MDLLSCPPAPCFTPPPDTLPPAHLCTLFTLFITTLPWAPTQQNRDRCDGTAPPAHCFWLQQPQAFIEGSYHKLRYHFKAASRAGQTHTQLWAIVLQRVSLVPNKWDGTAIMHCLAHSQQMCHTSPLVCLKQSSPQYFKRNGHHIEAKHISVVHYPR